MFKFDPQGSGPLFSVTKGFGERFWGRRIDSDASGPFDGGKDAVIGVEHDLLPGCEAESGEFEVVNVFGALADVVFGAIEVHPSGVVDRRRWAGDDFKPFEFWSGIFDSIDVMPIENEGLLGEIFECGGVLEEHIAPHCGSTPGGDHLVDERCEVVLIEPRFFVGIAWINGLARHALGATRAFAELGGLVAADVYDFGFECGDSFGDDVLAEGDELRT